MKLPEPQGMSFSALIGDIDKGQIKIPQFQRDFVWDIKRSANLLDSVIKGYPIGTFILWRTKERLRTIRNIGNTELPEPEEGDFVDYVLDGQQRITSLFASLKGLEIEREGDKIDDFSRMFVDLDASEDEHIVITDCSGKDEGAVIKLMDLIYGELTLLTAYDQKYHTKLSEYKKRMESYHFSIIQIKEAPIDIATEIFTRINEGGQPLSVFEIMVAKTYDHDSGFDLAQKFDDLIERLKTVNYETISNASVLQLIALILDKECKRKVILKIPKGSFIAVWNDAVDAIERAIDYFIGYYRIPVSQLLPYNALIIPFAYFFYHHKDKPTGKKQKYLLDFFWRVSLGVRYSSGVEGKLAQDIKRVDEILNNELPLYDWPIDISPEFIDDNGWFSAGRSYIKAILCLYVYAQPKSFNDNSIVNISNYWLKQANSKNYHHFFPKAYAKRIGEDPDEINHVLNITIVDDFLNKREIGSNAPSKYMKKFQKINDDLDATLKTHFIYDLDKFGVWEDDHDKFMEQRAKVVSRELKKRIIPQKIDRVEQEELVNDYEESEMD